MPDKTPDFTAENISFRYGRKEILSDAGIAASRGECIGIAGRNGCGKSTFLNILAGTVKPSSGRITCFGHDLLKEKSSFGKMTGFVPQTNPLIGELTVLDNLKLLSGQNISENDERLKMLSVSGMIREKVSNLSGGMQRRAAIACALMTDPPVLIMDEPTSALDLYHKTLIYDILEMCKNSGRIIIMATHDTEEMSFCSRLYLINQGSAKITTPESAASSIKSGL